MAITVEARSAPAGAAPLVIELRPGGEIEPAGPGERLVYQNILGRTKFTFGNGRGGDDLYLTAASGSVLARLEFQVRGDPAADLPYSVNFALYDNCPSQGGRVIAGVEARADVPDGQDYWVVVIPAPEVNITLPQRLWMAMTFTRPDAGWVGGNPALVGVTDNVFAEPIFGGCSLPLGTGFPDGPYSGFNASVFVREPANEVYYGYRGGVPDASVFVSPPGTLYAEDLELNAADCRMTAYEVSVRGTGRLQFDLREPGALGLPGLAIPGTELAFESTGNVLQIARRTFDPPRLLPPSLWLVVAPQSGNARALIGRPPATAGATLPTYAAFEEGGWVLKAINTPFADAVFSTSVLCEGQAPIGACCDMFQLDEAGEAVCRDLPRINCVYPPRGSGLLPPWQEGASCAAEPFDPPCGAAACCRADGQCENVSRNTCLQNAVSWTRGVYCDGLPEACEFLCIPSLGLCTSTHPEPGCSIPECCRDVCTSFSGDFCCVVEWDQACVALAEQVCSIPPFNDECAPVGQLTGARPIPVPGTVFNENGFATENPADPVFCCHGHQPGGSGLGTIWFRFVAPGSQVELDTCRSGSPAFDSMLQVFAVGDDSTPQTACASLTLLGCNDDDPACDARPENSRICLTGLTAGETYYVMLATKSDADRGRYAIEARTTCTVQPPGPCLCPIGGIEWLSPVAGALDARRPHPPDDPTARLGIDQLTVRSPGGSDRAECWHACESPKSVDPNAVTEVVTNVQQITSVLLARPQAPGAAQRVEFRDGFGSISGATFFSHPGNVNDDFSTNAQDALALLPIIDGAQVGVYGLMSSDIDRSGMTTPLDLLDLIDLLNGAEGYDSWVDSFRPDPPGFCP